MASNIDCLDDIEVCGLVVEVWQRDGSLGEAMETLGHLLLGWAAILAIPLGAVAIYTGNAWYALPLIFLVLRLVRFYRERQRHEEMSIAALRDSVRPFDEEQKREGDK